jgi:hypothetical protein
MKPVMPLIRELTEPLYRELLIPGQAHAPEASSEEPDRLTRPLISSLQSGSDGQQGLLGNDQE